MIVGIGTDIVKIARFEGKAENEKFMAKIFTASEREYLMDKGVQSMAGLFAAKEAVVKAMGCGFKGFWPKDIEILHDDMGRPVAKLYGTAVSAVHESTVFHISISHNETDAIAFAVAERNIKSL